MRERTLLIEFLVHRCRFECHAHSNARSLACMWRCIAANANAFRCYVTTTCTLSRASSRSVRTANGLQKRQKHRIRQLASDGGLVSFSFSARSHAAWPRDRVGVVGIDRSNNKKMPPLTHGNHLAADDHRFNDLFVFCARADGDARNFA